MRRLVVLFALACTSLAVSVIPLPSIRVAGWSEERVAQQIKALPSEQQGGWWIRVGDDIYSPALSQGSLPVEIDSEISHYWVVIGPQIPEDLTKLEAVHNPQWGVRILHSQHHPAIPRSNLNFSPVVPLQSGMKYFVQPHPTVDDGLDLEQDEELNQALSGISDDSYMAELNTLVNTGSGSDIQRNFRAEGHTTAEKYLACRMQRANLNVQLTDFETHSGTGRNIVGCLPGEDSKFLLVGAHFDTLPAPPSSSPGAMDNGSGVAVVLSVMEALRGYKFKHTLCFAAFDGEEMGLLGSHHLADLIKNNDELKKNFLGAVTSDMSTGFKPAAGGHGDPGWNLQNSKGIRLVKDDPKADGIHIDGDPNSRELIDLFASVAERVVTDQSVPILSSESNIWNSDQKSFISNGLPAIDICAANHRAYRFWHHLENVTSNLEPKIGKEIARTTVAAVFSLAQGEGSRDATPNSDTSTIPKFSSGRPIQTVFPDLSCAGYEAPSVTKTDDVPTSASTAMDEVAPAVIKKKIMPKHRKPKIALKKSPHEFHKRVKERPVKHRMSANMAREMDATLSRLEKRLARRR